MNWLATAIFNKFILVSSIQKHQPGNHDPIGHTRHFSPLGGGLTVFPIQPGENQKPRLPL
jgi:hypothetical protein